MDRPPHTLAEVRARQVRDSERRFLQGVEAPGARRRRAILALMLLIGGFSTGLYLAKPVARAEIERVVYAPPVLDGGP